MDNDANGQKRKAEEQKLIDEIRRKRACVERASSFPSEKDLQSKIRYFVRLIVDYVHSNDLENSFTELRGTRPQLFARREATLYKCRVEMVHLQAVTLIERIRSAAEALSMTHELYGLLVLARCASERSKRHFYREEEKGVSIEPSFTADFVRKELEFLSDLVHRVAAEVREAELQMESESHEGPLEEVNELIYELRRDLAERCLVLQEQVNKQGDEIKQAVQVVNNAGGSVEVQKPDKDKNGAVEPDRAEERQRPEVHSDKEAEEDLLDLYDDGGGQQSNA
ncbi:unnamed protein product [Heligmosomoides polygyrus]|uniref:Translin family protein n=1 Tax=Heligmosomoides polygyrus TaxID=6339 RepID=A0A183GDP1_HELPZ|nr:unnamed protein product [Heligmosomoides polygyrus]